MKKFFEYLGLLTLVCFSFFYTEKTVSVVKELDDIMIKIKEEAKNYGTEVKEAIIKGDTIIPGISGSQVNINASYQRMRKMGVYNSNYFVYDYIRPKQLLKDNLDKYIIGGNPIKMSVSLVFLVEERNNIDNILKILTTNNVKANFFIDGNWFEKNNEKVIDLIKQGYNVGNLSYNRDYQNDSFVWIDTIIKKIGNQKFSYCYKTDSKKDLEACALKKDYTISPTSEISSHPLIKTKEVLKSGSIIAFKVNDSLNQELDLIIKYIKSKNLNIVTLEDMLNEKSSFE